MLTPQDASKKACKITAVNLMPAGQQPGSRLAPSQVTGMQYGFATCIGPGCMAWRWSEAPTFGQTEADEATKRKGYCGLAGPPTSP